MAFSAHRVVLADRGERLRKELVEIDAEVARHGSGSVAWFAHFLGSPAVKGTCNIPFMRMGEGVEWGLHCCLVLAWLEDEAPVSTGRLAALFELPPVYLKKRLQALVRAGILVSIPGAQGGFRLARPPEKITLMGVVAAVEGPDEAFRCTEIRQRGAGTEAAEGEFARPCGIAAAMRRAELAWRRELAAQTLADLIANAPAAVPGRARRFYERLGG